MKYRIDRPDQDGITPEQRRCCKMLIGVMRGWHHCGNVRQFGLHGVQTALFPMSTFDSNTLTRLVLAAHEECIRVEIRPGGPGRIMVCLCGRRQRDGQFHERHPTIETAVESFRKEWGAPDFDGKGDNR